MQVRVITEDGGLSVSKKLDVAEIFETLHAKILMGPKRNTVKWM